MPADQLMDGRPLLSTHRCMFPPPLICLKLCYEHQSLSLFCEMPEDRIAARESSYIRLRHISGISIDPAFTKRPNAPLRIHILHTQALQSSSVYTLPEYSSPQFPSPASPILPALPPSAHAS